MTRTDQFSTMMIDKKVGNETKRRSPLLRGPNSNHIHRRPLLSPSKSRNGISSTSLSSFVNSQVQQHSTVASAVTVVDTISSSSRGTNANGSGKRRKGLLNTPMKGKSEEAERNQTNAMCLSCRNKLRLNGRGEYVCTRCGKIQSVSSAPASSFTGMPLMRQEIISSGLNDNHARLSRQVENRKATNLPALLDLPAKAYGMLQAPPSSFLSFPNNSTILASTSSAPTSLLALMNSNRRFLFSSSTMDDRIRHHQPLPSSTSSRSNGFSKNESAKHSSSRHHPYSRADYVRGADLKEMDSSKDKSNDHSKSKQSQSNLTNKSTTTDVDDEMDLLWLCQQRAAIDRRIIELQDRSESPKSDIQGLDDITFVSGYYCHTCRTLLRGDYSVCLSHCRTDAHLSNLANPNKDKVGIEADPIFKYYEEHYESIAFDGDETNLRVDESVSNTCTSSNVIGSCSVSKDKMDITSNKPSSHLDFDKNITCDDEKFDESGNDITTFSGRCPFLHNQTDLSDDDEDIEEPRKRERFDRTKMCERLL